MKRLLLITFTATIFNISAQQLVNVKGNVVSADEDKSLQVKKGEPLIGCPIKIKGTNKSTITNIDGNFKLPNVLVGSVLEISYSAFRTQEVKISNLKSPIKIKMKLIPYNGGCGVVMGYAIPAINNSYHYSTIPFFKFSTREELINTCKENTAIPLSYFNTNSSDKNFESFYKRSDKNPLSTFALSISSKSYLNCKTHLIKSDKPPKDLVRIEEFINKFPYNFPKTNDSLSIYSEYAECPWNKGNKLLLVNLKSKTEVNNAKIQLEFNPSKVKYYRLIGYENRVGNCENFDSILIDGGCLPNRHTITAIYEIEPANRKLNIKIKIDSLRYQSNSTFDNTNELVNIKLKYTDPSNNQRKQINNIVYNEPIDIEKASESMRFAVAVAEFAMLLKETEFLGDASYNRVIDLAESAKGTDENGERSEFIRYVKRLLSSPYYGLK